MIDITINIKLFGSFRKFGDSASVLVAQGSKIIEVKKALQIELNGEQLVMDSVLASNSNILRDDEVLNDNAELSILPPVCGG